MQHLYTLQLMPNVEVRDDGQDVLVAGPSGAALRLNRPGGAFRTLLDRLARGGLDRDAICDEAMGAGAEDRGVDLARLYFALGEIERKGIVRYTLAQRGHPLATLEPVAPAFRLEDVSIDGKFLLSRFACLRRVDATTRVESPLGRARVVIHDGRGAALLALLAAPHTAAELAAAMHDFDAATIAAFIALLANGKAVSACAENGRIAEDDSVPLRQWEFHDLLFHSRSRLGRHDYPYGGTYRFLDALPPLPAVKPPVSARRVALHRPDMRALDAGDVPFSRVAEARRSVRTHGEPLSALQLGEFLYRAARLKEVHPAGRERGSPYEASIRPCAGGGAVHELELYLTLSRCAGVEPGLYHYDPLAHELEHLADLGPRQKRLLADACGASGLDTPPDVLITLAARFQRVAWKYQSMAYAVTLKNTGALFQQMYLVATAMNLAPCGLGGGDSDLFAEAAGLDYYAETSVGEFMLSGRRPD